MSQLADDKAALRTQRNTLVGSGLWLDAQLFVKFNSTYITDSQKNNDVDIISWRVKTLRDSGS